MKTELIVRIKRFFLFAWASILALILALTSMELATRSAEGAYAVLVVVFLASILPARKIPGARLPGALFVAFTHGLLWAMVAITGQFGLVLAGIAIYALAFVSMVLH